MDYAQARYYNSNHGRFTSVDPLTASATIRNPQTFNRYSYVLNSPYKFTDPLGLLAENPRRYINSGDTDVSGLGGNYLYTSNELADRLRRQQPQPPPPPVAQQNAKPPSAPSDSPPIDSSLAGSPNFAPPQIVDVSQDSIINAELNKIATEATPVTGAREFSDIRYIQGELTSLYNATLLDADGNFVESGLNGYIRPIAVVVLDQGGNIVNSPTMTITENITAVSDEAKLLEARGLIITTSNQPVQQAGNGAFYDYQIRVINSILSSNIETSQTLQVNVRIKALWKFDANKIVENDLTRTINITPATPKRQF